MVVWRLARREFVARFDGAGNRDTGARWNSPGRGVIYASRTLSLCVLEVIVHLPSVRLLQNFIAAKIEVPDDAGCVHVGRDEMPADLWSPEAAFWCRERGDAWLQDGAALALVAPSVVVSLETNVMLNPGHDAIGRIRILDMRPFSIDSRLIDALHRGAV